MFTGIVSDIGTVTARDGGRLRIACHYDPKSFEPGASIACDGCCLTVISHVATGGETSFDIEASNETLERTTLGSWSPGRRINLERPLMLGAELGGHLVSGHVDGVARITARRQDGESVRFALESPSAFIRFIAAKGSVALNGVSLTVNDVDGTSFVVNIIPYTLTHTTWGDLKPDDLLNLEVDLLARYVERIATREASRP